MLSMVKMFLSCKPMIWRYKINCMLLNTIAVQVCAGFKSIHGCHLPSGEISGYLNHPGDLVIGGTFPVHVGRSYTETHFTSKPEDIKCQLLEFQNYQSLQALIFAVEEINNTPDLLPNITLGFQIFDTCTVLRRAAEGTLWMLSGGQEQVPNYRCGRDGSLAGIVGDSGSTRSIFMAQILGLYRHPQISYFSTSPLLSNRNMFPSFFRTVPSDTYQSRGLAELILHFGWTWVGLLATDNDYGQLGIQVVKQELIKAGACVAFVGTILTGHPNRNAPHIVTIIKGSTAKVVVILSSDSDFMPVVEELANQNVTGKIWIASESWSTSTLLSNEKFQQVLVGTIGFAVHGGQMPGFVEHLNGLLPSTSPNDPFIREFWGQTFSCNWDNLHNLDTWMKNKTIPFCTEEETLEGAITNVDFRITFSVYTSIYTFAWALQNLLQCTPRSGPFHHGTCANISSLHPWQLLRYIKTVNFQTKDKTRVFFNDEGEPQAVYDIVNWQIRATNTLQQVVVGTYDLSSSNGYALSIDSAAIVWTTGVKKVPQSKCSPNCPSGFRKMSLPANPSCCYECVPCPQGEISDKIDSVKCQYCSWNMWPNLLQNMCIPRTIEFLSYNEAMGINLATITPLSSLIPIIILGLFIHYRTTPIVRANNWSLSCLLLLSLCLCFLCSLAFIGYPQPEKCLLRQVAFGLAFSLCISCVLAKTITVVIAFKATRPGTTLRRWTGAKVSYSVIVICFLIQVSICVTWLSCSPPFPEYNNQTESGVIILSCNEGSPLAFWTMLGYLGLLATISFIVAFLARRLPDSFNEAKFITFSMLVFLSVWLSFIPAFLSSRGKYTAAMEIFAILSSSWAVLVCIFFPKCFVILFRPEMNSRNNLMRKDRSRN